tara:strand:- start:516 stop:962 length:447 start_codon:yes stop_codon:yes gene_type:complete
MIITCPSCEKKFEIDQKLIPSEGRMLQCGSCDHKWFFKINTDEKIVEEKNNIDTDNNSENYIDQSAKSLEKSLKDKEEKIIPEKKNDKESINYLNIIIVVIISIAACILILDTFEKHLVSIFPNISFILDNLYQSIEDVKLFILDLVN